MVTMTYLSGRTIVRNTDGLNIYYGANEGGTSPGVGEYRTNAGGRMHEIVIPDMTKVPSTDGSLLIDGNVMVPKGAFIEKVEVITHTVCTGSGATLNLGLVKTDLATELDFNGILAAVAVTSMDSAGETVSYTATTSGAGALVGVVTNGTSTGVYADGLYTVDYDTAAFTAGAITIRISFSF